MMRGLLLTTALLISSAAMAQEEAAPAAASENAEPVTIEIKKEDVAPIEPYPEGFRSLFYTQKEHKALLDSIARKITPVPRGDQEEIDVEDQVIVKEQGPPPPRVLHLSGIVYTSAQDWTVWLNGKRLVPADLPDTVKDIRVAKEYVDLKWFDETTSAVVPVRLRPHQRFNIDSKTFMPGSGQ